MKLTLKQLKEARAELEKDENNFLRNNGWENECNFPGSLWLWCKELIDGRTIAVNKDTALRIEEKLQT